MNEKNSTILKIIACIGVLVLGVFAMVMWSSAQKKEEDPVIRQSAVEAQVQKQFFENCNAACRFTNIGLLEIEMEVDKDGNFSCSCEITNSKILVDFTLAKEGISLKDPDCTEKILHMSYPKSDVTEECGPGAYLKILDEGWVTCRCK